MKRVAVNWARVWPFLLLWGAAPMPLYIWLIIYLLNR